jgi:hypothetical protein
MWRPGHPHLPARLTPSLLSFPCRRRREQLGKTREVLAAVVSASPTRAEDSMGRVPSNMFGETEGVPY